MNESNSPSRTATTSRDLNADPITGEPGSHPVGTGIGAAGAGAAGAAIGMVAGPVGAAVGAVIGAVAGGLAGHGVAESIDPTAEDAYWRSNYKNQSYASGGDSNYEDYQGAYRTGYTGFAKHGTAGRSFDQAEGDLKNDWENTKGDTKIGWEKAKMATRDAWHRVANTASNATDKVSDSVTGSEAR